MSKLEQTMRRLERYYEEIGKPPASIMSKLEQTMRRLGHY
jgi:hypothetical protein